MSEEPASRRNVPPNSKQQQRPSRSNGSAMKWAAGAAAAAVLLGGGYYAWSNSGQRQAEAVDTSEIADNSFTQPSTFNEPTVASPAEASGAATLDQGATTQATVGERATTPARARTAKKTSVAAAAIPEQTIGVSQHADATLSEELVVTPGRRPVWRYTPTAARLSEYYPTYALERGREGEASLSCTVGKGGLLSCVPVSESPARAGFGTAAVRVARTFRHAALRADGSEALGTPVNLRVLFRMENDRRG